MTARAGEGLDYSYGGMARSFPGGLAAFGRAGYGLLLWGEKTPGSVFYGYLRPELRLQSSILVDMPEASLSIYPVSFAGIRIGRAESFRFTDFPAIDCVVAECRGRVSANFLKTQVALGYADFFVVHHLHYRSLAASRPERPIGDEQSSFIGKPGQDSVLFQTLAIGMKLGDYPTAGLLLETGRMLGTGAESDHESVFFRLAKKESWTYVVGAGLYRSTTHERGFTFYGALTVIGIPSVELD